MDTWNNVPEGQDLTAFTAGKQVARVLKGGRFGWTPYLNYHKVNEGFATRDEAQAFVEANFKLAE